MVSANRKTGFIDRLGRWVSPPHIGDLDFLDGGFVAVVDQTDGKTGDEWGYMRRDGRFIWRASIAEAPTHEMWPVVGFEETQKQTEIQKSCHVDPA